MALKSALAATVAWAVALRLPGAAADYAFYAPFGAVVTMYPAVMRSAAEATRGVGAIVLGAVVGHVGQAVLGNGAVAIAVVVTLTVLLAGLPWLEESRAYVPVAGVFVLVLGQGDELVYAASYAGLFLLGAAFTVVVNAALPSAPPVRSADRAVDELRDEAATHLRHLAAALTADAGTNESEVVPERRRLAALTDEARRALAAVEESAHGNRRARHQRNAIARRREELGGLERAVLLVDDIYDMARDEPWGTNLLAVSSTLRGPLAAALEQLAAALTSIGLHDTTPGRRADADAAVRDLVIALTGHEGRSGGPGAESLVVASVATTLRRTLSVLTPTDRIRLSPAPGAENGADAGGDAATGTLDAPEGRRGGEALPPA